MDICYLDFETYSGVDLKKCGAYRYAFDHTFAPVLLAYAFGDGAVVVHDFRDGGLPDPVVDHIKAGGVVAGFGQFDRIILMALGQDLPPSQYLDIMALAAVDGRPRSLAGCGKALKCSLDKLFEGKEGIQKFCKPYRGERRYPGDFPELWEKFVAYAGVDVELAREIHHKLPPLSEREQMLYETTCWMNDRGIQVDLDACRTLFDLSTEIKARADEIMAEVTGGEVVSVGQVARIAKWCGTPGASEGVLRVGLAAMNKEQRMVAKLRMVAGRSSTAKLETALKAAGIGGRVRGCFMYCGTSTLRWAGRVIQPQNFPRDCFDADEFDHFIGVADGGYRQVVEAYQDPLKAISRCLRGVLVPAPGHIFIVADYAQIEARVLAWLAQQKDALAAYEAGTDLYREMAASVFNVKSEEVTKDQRFIGKTLILGAGYNLGPAGFRRNLSGIGVEVSAMEAETYIKAFRSKFSKLPVLWQALIGAFHDACAGKIPNDVADKRLQFRLEGDTVSITLPSGTRLKYHGVYIKKAAAPWDPEILIDQAYAIDAKINGALPVGPQTLTENVCSALARDLMGAAMIRCERNGYPVVMTVHDELVVEVPDTPDNREHGVERVSRMMCRLPPWGRDLPLKVEGAIMTRYGK